MIDMLDSLEELMSGKRKPDTMQEDIFMQGFRHGLLNEDYLDKYIEMTTELEYDDARQWHALSLGYGMGQKKREEEIAEFDNINEQKH